VNRNIIYVQSSLSVHLWIASHFLLSIQSIPFSVSKKKHRHTTNHPFIMPRSRNGRRSGTCFTPEIVGISQSSIDEFRRCPMWIVERINGLPYHINYANRARKTGGQQGI
jgi:hypothetical protein